MLKCGCERASLVCEGARIKEQSELYTDMQPEVKIESCPCAIVVSCMPTPRMTRTRLVPFMCQGLLNGDLPSTVLGGKVYGVWA